MGSHVDGEVTYTVSEGSDLTKPSPTMGKFFRDTQAKQVDMTVTSPFLLTKPDFSKTEVVQVYTIVLLSITDNRQSKSRKGLSCRG